MQLWWLYPAFAALWLTLVACGFIPRTRWNQGATVNNLGRVHMQAPEYYIETGQSMRGVYAQERIECWLKNLMFFSVIGLLVIRTRFYFRQSEFIGHAAEIVVAGREGFDRDKYLHNEAAVTYRNTAYKGIFDHLDLDGMKRALRRRFWIAHILIALHAVALARMP